MVTKTPTSGGMVKVLTLMEHLVYEVHDPHNYIMPDGISDITAIKLEQMGKDKVKITKYGEAPRGKARPENLKLCVAYNDGFISSAYDKTKLRKLVNLIVETSILTGHANE